MRFVSKWKDQDLERKMFEECKLKGEKICNPIIDWTEDDVWDFIDGRNLPVNPMYKMGFKRVGCIGCPYNGDRKVLFTLWPKYKKAYIDAMERGIKLGKEKGKVYTWEGGAERFEFWLTH